jgi:hypothetical protein
MSDETRSHLHRSTMFVEFNNKVMKTKIEVEKTKIVAAQDAFLCQHVRGYSQMKVFEIVTEKLVYWKKIALLVVQSGLLGKNEEHLVYKTA